MLKTNEEFLNELQQKHPHVKALEKYINNDIKIKFYCMRDEHEWYSKPRTILLAKEPCPLCRNKNKRTTESFKEELKKINPNITVLSEYKGAHKKVKCKCNIDGYEWSVEPNSLLSAKQGCPKCGGTLNLTHDEYILRLSNVNPNIKIISEYKNFKTYVTCECAIDGHIWDAYPQNLLKGHGCPICSARRASEKNTKSHKQFVDEIANISPNIIITGTYTKSIDPISCKCKICGNEWNTVAQNLISGKGCPECKKSKLSDLLRKDVEIFKDELYLINPNIEIIGEYINSYTKVLCRCKKDDFVWSALPSNLLRGTGCPICNSSHGEQKITNYLKLQNISFIPQYKFEQCKNQRKLPFDFYLPDFNMCIEYDGLQHYKPVCFGGCSYDDALLAFKQTKANDKIKNHFCNSNDINLLRIPYYEFNNIAKILKDKLC